ncbi:hypothetical protein K469DRAFT_93792 [Zopfia rhizophila CBS 207.26]|uniref:F-box domain-containing protein n=1 Tax=Zopfia rhizophila CBS 207.26 TaxID=1314779 RepID=A0A6A6ECM5_9PEZI|nr:hypothetical protein K469DRAFT_93792 [Zopfia rhizophila CBS 207.26]
MGNLLSRAQAQVPPPAPKVAFEALETPRRRNLQHRHEFCSSGPDKYKARKHQRQIATSFSANKSRAGFLDLPAELRNFVYSRILICDGYVRLMPREPTRVPALVLLQTCKQIHDEAASIFYAANSFYVHVEKFVGIMAQQAIEYPEFSKLYGSFWGQETAKGGVFFPAPRYHVYLTRLTIDAQVYLKFHKPDYAENSGYAYAAKPKVPVQQHLDIHRTGQELNKLFFSFYEKVRDLWEEKERRWEGKMVSCQDGWCSTAFNFTMTFSEEENEEVASKGVWRRWALSQ